MIRQFSAGGVVYRKEAGNILFLLKRNSLTPGYYASGEWSLPKGWLDDSGPDQPGPETLGQKRVTSEEVQAAALREVREETGVEAKIISRLGTVQFFFVDHHREKVLKTVIYFLMEYLSNLSEGFSSETSEIKWVGLDDAATMLAKRKGEYEIIKKAADNL
jgi:8-oxo-dGTP pyrophosphatase MutT (NUDIX family)